MSWFAHVDRRCGHVFLSLLWHNVQLGFGWVIGRNMCFKWFHVYCAHHNVRVWTICPSDMPVFSKRIWRVYG